MISPASPAIAELQVPAPPPDADLVANQVLDVRGLRCPLPLLRAKQALRGLESGALLQVMTSDPASVADFAAYARLSGEQLLAFDIHTGDYIFWFKKH